MRCWSQATFFCNDDYHSCRLLFEMNQTHESVTCHFFINKKFDFIFFFTCILPNFRWNEVFFNIPKKPSISEKKLPHMKAFSLCIDKKKIENPNNRKLKKIKINKCHFQLRQVSFFSWYRWYPWKLTNHSDNFDALTAGQLDAFQITE